jgi:UDP-3-O-[3-hydroxymyristoyl] N-acetylglucosamine deacetylase
MIVQKTVKKDVLFAGLGVHSGDFVRIRISPSDADSGIIFVHADYPEEPLIVGAIVPLQAMHATVLRQQSWLLSTVEHLMAALRMAGVDNAVIHVDGREIPILDGSAAPFFHEIIRKGLVDQSVRKKFITPLQPIEFEEQGGKKIYLKPLTDDAVYGLLQCEYEAAFNHFSMGRKILRATIDQQLFKDTIAPARTFGFLEQLPFLRNHKLALASSLGNTLVFNSDEAINDNRIADEWLGHKVLDFIGDLGLLPYTFTGHVTAAHTSHAFNRCIVQHYLANQDAWAII